MLGFNSNVNLQVSVGNIKCVYVSRPSNVECDNDIAKKFFFEIATKFNDSNISKLY